VLVKVGRVGNTALVLKGIFVVVIREALVLVVETVVPLVVEVIVVIVAEADKVVLAVGLAVVVEVVNGLCVVEEVCKVVINGVVVCGNIIVDRMTLSNGLLTLDCVTG